MLSWCYRLVRALTACLLVLSFLAAVEPARNDKWTVLGPGGGGAQFTPTVSPHNPNRVLVSCDMTGSYISNDGGGSWRMFNLRGRTRFFVFDPSAPDTIYAQGIGLWRSTDAGVSWNLIHPVPASVTGIAMPDDHAGERIMTADRACAGESWRWRSIRQTPASCWRHLPRITGRPRFVPPPIGGELDRCAGVRTRRPEDLHRPRLAQRRQDRLRDRMPFRFRA